MAISELYIEISMKRWAKPIVVLCVLCKLTPPDWCFSISDVKSKPVGAA